jgi:hypothetical protein
LPTSGVSGTQLAAQDVRFAAAAAPGDAAVAHTGSACVGLRDLHVHRDVGRLEVENDVEKWILSGAKTSTRRSGSSAG